MSDSDSTKVSLTFGVLYLQMGKLHVALHYLTLATASSNIYTRRSAYNNLYSLYKSLGEYSTAIGYNDLYWACVDSISKIETRKEVHSIQMRYNTMKLTAEKQAMANQVMNRNLIMVCLIAVCSILALVLCYVTIRKQHKILLIQAALSNMQKAVLSNERVINHNQVEISSLKQTISDKVTDMEILKDASETQLAAKQSEIDVLQNDVSKLTAESSLLDTINEKLKKRIQELTITIQQRNKSIGEYVTQLKRHETTPNILLRVKQTQQITEYEWNEFFAAVDALHQNFTERLIKQHSNLTPKDVRLCVLIRLGYDTPVIQTILHLEEDSLYKSSSRLKQRLFNGRSFKNGDLEKYLCSF